MLSPLLLNATYSINDLVRDLKQLNTGLDNDGENICMLFYADDVILFGNTEEELQLLLKCYIVGVSRTAHTLIQ